MIGLRADEIAGLTGGRRHRVKPDAVVSGPAAVDSRQVEPGGLFVAVAGERVDGHDFAAQAVASGAVAVLTSRPVDAPCIVVDDTVTAIGLVAAEVVRRLNHTTVIGITGSQGKTSTKDLLHQVLETHGETIATSGNLNNELGVPLTVTRATESTRYLVVEMGARHIGNIAYLCDIAQPHIAVVVNVGVAHLGEFGSQQDIARAKGELVEAVPADGAAVLNADDALVTAMSRRTSARTIGFGEQASADVRIAGLAVSKEGEPTFRLEYVGDGADVHLRLLGRHQAFNAAAAAAAAVGAGLSLDAISHVLNTAAHASQWRMERHQMAGGGLLINDAYNANPDSMRAALSTLHTIGSSRNARTVAVLGAMLELGDTAAAEHREVGRLADSLGVDELVVVGDDADGIVRGWSRERVHRVADVDTAVDVVDDLVAPGDVILVKASRATGLERVARDLLDHARHTSSRPSTDGGKGADERISRR